MSPFARWPLPSAFGAIAAPGLRYMRGQVTAKDQRADSGSVSGITIAKSFRQEQATYELFATNNRASVSRGREAGTV